MKLLTKAQYEKLLENGRKQAKVRGTTKEHDFYPVVKLFHPYGAGTWLLTEIDPEAPDIAFGIADLGVSCPEAGTVSLSELESLKLGVGVPRIERDRHFKADKPLSRYLAEAINAGHIAA